MLKYVIPMVNVNVKSIKQLNEIYVPQRIISFCIRAGFNYKNRRQVSTKSKYKSQLNIKTKQ